MKKTLFFVLTTMLSTLGSHADNKGQIKIHEVPFTAVHCTDNFWAPRIDTIRTVTIPYAFQRSEKAGYIDNFAIAGGLKQGKFQSFFPFDDAEVYKISEGASYLLTVKKNPQLEAYLDSVIAIIASAQEPDGYLFTNHTINNPLHDWVDKERWLKDWDLSHETFNAGELYEAAIAYYYATGKRSLLDVAIKNADLICDTFHENGLKIAPGHQVIEMALVRLYEATGDEKYLKQSRFFLECRGRREFDQSATDIRKNGMYWQDHLPVVEQKEAVGHAVRALYLYSGMADIALHMQDKAYLNAIDTIWDNIVSKKMYLTGGLGSTAHNEAFGKNYDLPNATAYCETCASIANCMFNLRMFKLHGDSKYIDVLERSLYNTVLSGISISGDKFFYPNVLDAGKKGQERSLWFDCSCCPTNLSRFIPAVPGYVYAVDEQSIYTNLFVGSSSEVQFNGQKVLLEQQTAYPWSGEVKIVVDPVETNVFNLKIRIPGWVDGEVVPSDLYRFVEQKPGKAEILLNGKPYSYQREKGYAVIANTWKKGDVVTVNFPMESRQVVSNEAVKTNNGLIAVERGPLVYCAEFMDNNGEVSNLSLPENTSFKVKSRPDLIHGINTIEAAGKKYISSPDRKEIKEENTVITFIPYYARAYRGAGEMKVWLPKSGEKIVSELRNQLRVVDEVLVGNDASEKAHNLKGDKTRADQSGGWRDAEDGWFSYELEIDPARQMELVLTYHSIDGGNRQFEIWVDNLKIAEQSLRRETFDLFIDHPYPLPQTVTKGKKKVTVKLQSLPGNIAGGIFGCKIRERVNE